MLALRLADFRNIPALRLELEGRDVFLVGDNGQGKTNFLEAVYLLCYGASFRARNDRDLIANGAAAATLWGAAERRRRGTRSRDCARRCRG